MRSEPLQIISPAELKSRQSEYFKTQIAITPLYGWKVCYFSNETARIYEEMLEHFKQLGYTLKGEHKNGSCPRLHEEGTLLDMYMHPMEFTGMGTDEQIHKIRDIIEGFLEKNTDRLPENKRGTSYTYVQRQEILYDIPDKEYAELIYANAEEIARRYLTAKGFFDSFDLVDELRIERVQFLSSGMSCLDPDAVCVEDIIGRAKQLKEQGVSIREIPAKVAAEAQTWADYKESVQNKIIEHCENGELDKIFKIMRPSMREDLPADEKLHFVKSALGSLDSYKIFEKEILSDEKDTKQTERNGID